VEEANVEWSDDAVFVQAVQIVLQHEGGYVDNPADPGGATNFGISQRSYPNLDIKGLTRDEAATLYFRDWWLKFGYERLPAPVGIKLMDLAVPAPAAAHRSLQRGLRANGVDVIDDGILGPVTVAAAQRCESGPLITALRSEFAGYCRMVAANHLAVCGAPDPFLRGWLTRAYA
jgi:lysozyme family protein